MAIRIRLAGGHLIAICAARSVPQEGDFYIDDGQHHALAEKFAEDFQSEGFNTHPYDVEASRQRHQEEANNPAREWWDSVYAGK